MPRLHRRAILTGFGAALAAGSALAQPAPTPLAAIQAALGDGQRFDSGVLFDLARQLSRRPFVPLPNDLPDAFANLNYEQYVGIRSLQAPIWSGEGRGIALEPLHRGFVFANAVALHAVEDGVVRRLSYDRSRFDFGRINVPQTLGEIGFSGFKLSSTFGNGQPVDFAIVQGATFFRALARGQNFGVVARGLTLKPAEARGEEFPFFRAFWLERPGPGTNTLVAHGLIDSESATAAIRFTFRPGDVTIVDVELTLFPRANLEHVGLGGMGTTYLYGPNDRRNSDDLRPAVYESAGLQMFNSQGEWLWRPLHNPETLQISAFVDQAPRGFGLLQRERAFEAFQDDDQRYERRPSLWIEPIGTWNPGTVQLLEIPSDSEVNDNILAYWRPRAPMTVGSEVALAFRQYWCWAPPERPPLAVVTATRVGRGGGGRRRRFAVDLSGEMLGEGAAPDLKPVVTVGPGSILGVRLWPYPERKAVRVAFELDPGNENSCEMRLVLEAGGRAVSEIWLYRWTP